MDVRWGRGESLALLMAETVEGSWTMDRWTGVEVEESS